MALSVSEAIKTAFGSLKTDVGKKLIGIFFVIQALNFGSSYLASMGGSGMAALGGILAVLAGVVSIAATIGGLRSFRDGSLEKEFFTDNILWPFGRTLGANITTAVFAYLTAAVFMLPAFLTVLGGSMAMGAGLSSLSGAGIAGLALGGLGAILGLAALIYVTVTLILSQPLIAIEDKRMFQALDESIQRTKGSRLEIFLTGLITGAVYLLALAVALLGTLINQQLGGALVQLVVAPVFVPVFLSLMNHFSEELPLQ